VNYRLSAEAKSDLRTIFIYSLKEYGEVRSDKYLEALYAIFETISQNPEIGLSPDFQTRNDVRKFPSLKHVIYYVITPKEIEIRRIFHGSREIDDLDMRPF